MDFLEQNSPRAWLLAARPKTLSGAAVPVMIALAMAWADSLMPGRPAFLWWPAALCLLFAFIMQVDANFVNDYFDFRRGNDGAERLGPERACTMGWVTPQAMVRAICITTLAACIVGLPLVMYGGVEMVLVGALCVLFCFLYTTHLSYVGMGDVLVLVFFGIVPVCVTYYLQQRMVTLPVVVASVACGLVIDTLLVVNNYRDIDNDRRAGKRTLIVMMGEQGGQWLYLWLGIVACLLGCVHGVGGRWWAFLLPLMYLVLHIATYRRMMGIGKGRALNRILGLTARNIFVYGVLTAAGMML